MHIDSYKFGSITIDGQNHRKDVILFPDHLQTEWFREEGHLLQLQDLEAVFAANPKKLIVGMGASGNMAVDETVKDECAKRGIELITKMTEEATQEFNELDDKSETITALHLTC